jgi:hypothetical protein
VRFALVVALILGCVEGGGEPIETNTDASIDSSGSDTAADGSMKTCDPAADPCPPDQHCSPILRQCIPGCRADAGCAKGRCDVANHECVDCLTSTDCRADEVCSGGKCVPGCTPDRACPSGLTCCTGACIDPMISIEHCGGCGTKCTVANGSPACAAGKCAIASCKTPFENCDGNPVNGCEVDTTASRDHCGGCGKPCNPSNGTGACALGVCKVASCASGFGDCNSSAADGCEANFATDPKNCGSCGAAPTETCNLKDDNCNGACDDIDGCRKGIHHSSNGKDHFYTDSSTESGCCGYTVAKLNAFYLYSAIGPDTTAFYRCYAASAGLHFYTTSSTCEIYGAGAVESVMGFIATKDTCGSTPLYRLWNPTTAAHVYTIDGGERSSLIGAGWKDEGITGYVWSAPRG